MSHIPTGRRRYVFNQKTGRLEEVVPKDNPFHWLSLLPASYAKPPKMDEVFEVKRALALLRKLEEIPKIKRKPAPNIEQPVILAAITDLNWMPGKKPLDVTESLTAQATAQTEPLQPNGEGDEEARQGDIDWEKIPLPPQTLEVRRELSEEDRQTLEDAIEKWKQDPFVRIEKMEERLARDYASRLSTARANQEGLPLNQRHGWFVTPDELVSEAQRNDHRGEVARLYLEKMETKQSLKPLLGHSGPVEGGYLVQAEDTVKTDHPPIIWHKLSEKKPPKEGIYLTWFPAGSLVYPELAYQNVRVQRWGIPCNASTEPEFFDLSITHWAEFNLPHEQKE